MNLPYYRRDWIPSVACRSLVLLQGSTTVRKVMPLGIDCYRLYAIPRFARQPISGVFGHDLQTNMSVADVVANEPGSRHNVSCFAALVGHSSKEVASHLRYVGCSAELLFAHTLYEPIVKTE
jgi:hypothetical protein